MEKICVVVRRKWFAARDIVGLELAPEPGTQLPPFTAGSHVDLHISQRDASRTVVRQYSLCNAPGETQTYVLGIKLEPESRGGSLGVHRDVQEGDRLFISAPRNNFSLHDTAGPSILFGAGIGITPLLAMAQSMEYRERCFELHYFTRSLEFVAFRERLERAETGGRVHFHYGLTPEGTEAAVRAALTTLPPDAHVYSCGPTPFMEMVGVQARRRISPQNVHFEYFQAPVELSAGGEAFEVVAARSGVSCMVPADKTIVQALYERGVVIDVSCEQGVCGTCVTRVLSGEPDHRDVYLSDTEKQACDQMTPCCSRAKGERLVLDI
ncbi:vanillate O-demethylase ferredoxin subunit [Burkholderia sp. GAS332]|nr:vanillate O-demethylase ferredoxin subunit [Burkholderia sp. GAS332]